MKSWIVHTRACVHCDALQLLDNELNSCQIITLHWKRHLGKIMGPKKDGEGETQSPFDLSLFSRALEGIKVVTRASL